MREGAHNERYGETAEHEVCASQSRPQLKYSRLYLSNKILLLVSWRALLPGAAFGRKPFSLKDSLEVVLGSSEAGGSTMRLWCGPEVREMPRRACRVHPSSEFALSGSRDFRAEGLVGKPN